MHVRLMHACSAILGEGPLWDGEKGRLYWLDIRASRLFWTEPSSGAVQTIELDVMVTALGLRRDHILVAVAGKRAGLLDPVNGRFEAHIAFEHDRPGNRSNDGAVLSDGRFWFGTMDDHGAPSRGAVYALNRKWMLERIVDGVTIPNGIVEDIGRGRIYMADSGEKKILRFDLHHGAISDPQLFTAAAEASDATPDGACLDEEGCLWSAQWDGACVLRLNPDGDIIGRIALPVTRPTSCAFGGHDLRTLYITSAREGLSEAALQRQPLAGALFAVDLHVRGVRSLFFPS